MSKNYINEGDVLPHIAAGAIASGDIVTVGPLLGVALGDAATDEVVSVKVSGVFDVVKATGAISVGALVNYDESTGEFKTATTSASGDITGGCVCTVAALSGDATVRVKFLPGVGTLS